MDFPSRFTPAPLGEPFNPETDFEVKMIVDHRIQGKKRQVKIRWVGYGPESDEWTDLVATNCEEELQRYIEARGVVTVAELFSSKRQRLLSF